MTKRTVLPAGAMLEVLNRCHRDQLRTQARRRQAPRASVDAIKKLHPRRMLKNPVMFVVEVGSAFTTLLFVPAALTDHGDAHPGFIMAVALWLWFTVLFANYAEAMAEGRGKAQADTLRKARRAHARAGIYRIHQQHRGDRG